MGRKKQKCKADFNFPDSAKVKPKGFKGLGVDDDVTIVTKGKVIRIEDNAEDWDPGKHLKLEVKSCEIVGPEKKVSIDEAVKSAQQKA